MIKKKGETIASRRRAEKEAAAKVATKTPRKRDAKTIKQRPFVDTPESESRIESTIKGAASKLEHIKASDDLAHKSTMAHAATLKNLGGKKFAIFDLDGCVSDDEWRLIHVIEHDEPDTRFHAYHSFSHLDDPLAEGLKVLRRVVSSGVVPIFVTARPEIWRLQTAAWLRLHAAVDFDSGSFIAMRPTGHKSSTVDLKMEAVKAMTTGDKGANPFTGILNIIAAYDDREDIVEAYHKQFGIRSYVLDKHGVRDHNNHTHSAARTTAENRTFKKTVESVDPIRSPESRVFRQGEPRPVENVISAEEMAEIDKMFKNNGQWTPNPPAADSLDAARSTLLDRAQQYGRSDLMEGAVLAALFPNGVQLDGPEQLRLFHMFGHVVGKLSRFASSGMTHRDSIHDAINYVAFCDSIVKEIQEKSNV